MMTKVHFAQNPVTSISRGPNVQELRALQDLEEHLFYCRTCYVAQTSGRFISCRAGSEMSERLSKLLYRADSGKVYTRLSVSDTITERVEIPRFFRNLQGHIRQQSDCLRNTFVAHRYHTRIVDPPTPPTPKEYEYTLSTRGFGKIVVYRHHPGPRLRH